MAHIAVDPDLIKKEISCVTSKVMIRYAEHCGLPIDEFLQDIPYPYEYLVNEKNWIMLKYSRLIFKRLNQMLDDPLATYKAGKFSYRDKSLGFVEILAKLFSGPDICYRICERFSWKFNHIYKMTPLEVTKNTAVIQVRYFPEFEATKDGCNYTRGVLEMVPTGWNLPPATTEEQQCQAEGADSCIYHLNFSNLSFFSNLWSQIFGKNEIMQKAYLELEENYEELDRQKDELVLLNKKIKEQILREKRLERIMIGGFAHEIGNAISGGKYELEALINQCKEDDFAERLTDLAKIFYALKSEKEINHDDLQKAVQHLKFIKSRDERFQESMQNVFHDMERSLAIKDQLRSYSRLQEEFRGNEDLDLLEIMNKVVQGYRQQLEDRVIEIKTPQTGSFPLMGTLSHLDSIIRNLLINAIDAVSDSAEKIISLQISKNTIDAEQFYQLEITDTGIGISEDQKKNIFEPFYTTKPATGTGLGLPWSQKLAGIYGGDIKVKSSPGKGSTFTVLLKPK